MHDKWQGTVLQGCQAIHCPNCCRTVPPRDTSAQRSEAQQILTTDVSSISNAQLGECWLEFSLTLCVPFLPAKVHEQPPRTSPLLRAPGGRAMPLSCVGTTWEITVTSKMHRPVAYLWLQKISAPVTLLVVSTETEPTDGTPSPARHSHAVLART